MRTRCMGASALQVSIVATALCSIGVKRSPAPDGSHVSGNIDRRQFTGRGMRMLRSEQRNKSNASEGTHITQGCRIWSLWLAFIHGLDCSTLETTAAGFHYD